MSGYDWVKTLTNSNAQNFGVPRMAGLDTNGDGALDNIRQNDNYQFAAATGQCCPCYCGITMESG